MNDEIDPIEEKDIRKNSWYKSWKKERKFMPEFAKNKVFKEKNKYSRNPKHKNRINPDDEE